MNWKNFWNELAAHPDSMTQVGRIGGNAVHTDDMLQQYSQHIIEICNIKPEHSVLDVCCGNGIITALLSKKCRTIIGVDISERLIAQAQSNYPHISFYVADVVLENLTEQLGNQTFDRITICFSFQYFETPQAGLRVIENLNQLLAPGGKIILSDVPDSRYFLVYYNSLKKLAQLAWKMARNRNDMGKFWSVSELNWIAEQTRLKGTYLKQPPHLPYAHYRMDYVYEKA